MGVFLLLADVVWQQRMFSGDQKEISKVVEPARNRSGVIEERWEGSRRVWAVCEWQQ